MTQESSASQQSVFIVEEILDHAKFTDLFYRKMMYKKYKHHATDAIDGASLMAAKKGSIVSKYMYRVRWQGYAPEEDTWEPENNFLDGNGDIIQLMVEYKQEHKLDPAIQTIRLNFSCSESGDRKVYFGFPKEVYDSLRDRFEAWVKNRKKQDAKPVRLPPVIESDTEKSEEMPAEVRLKAIRVQERAEKIGSLEDIYNHINSDSPPKSRNDNKNTQRIEDDSEAEESEEERRKSLAKAKETGFYWETPAEVRYEELQKKKTEKLRRSLQRAMRNINDSDSDDSEITEDQASKSREEGRPIKQKPETSTTTASAKEAKSKPKSTKVSAKSRSRDHLAEWETPAEILRKEVIETKSKEPVQSVPKVTPLKLSFKKMKSVTETTNAAAAGPSAARIVYLIDDDVNEDDSDGCLPYIQMIPPVRSPEPDEALAMSKESQAQAARPHNEEARLPKESDTAKQRKEKMPPSAELDPTKQQKKKITPSKRPVPAKPPKEKITPPKEPKVTKSQNEKILPSAKPFPAKPQDEKIPRSEGSVPAKPLKEKITPPKEPKVTKSQNEKILPSAKPFPAKPQDEKIPRSEGSVPAKPLKEKITPPKEPKVMKSQNEKISPSAKPLPVESRNDSLKEPEPTKPQKEKWSPSREAQPIQLKHKKIVHPKQNAPVNLQGETIPGPKSAELTKPRDEKIISPKELEPAKPQNEKIRPLKEPVPLKPQNEEILPQREAVAAKQQTEKIPSPKGPQNETISPEKGADSVKQQSKKTPSKKPTSAFERTLTTIEDANRKAKLQKQQAAIKRKLEAEKENVAKNRDKNDDIIVLDAVPAKTNVAKLKDKPVIGCYRFRVKPFASMPYPRRRSYSCGAAMTDGGESFLKELRGEYGRRKRWEEILRRGIPAKRTDTPRAVFGKAVEMTQERREGVVVYTCANKHDRKFLKEIGQKISQPVPLREIDEKLVAKNESKKKKAQCK